MIVFYVLFMVLDQLVDFLECLPFFTFALHFFLRLALDLDLRLQVFVPQLLIRLLQGIYLSIKPIDFFSILLKRKLKFFVLLLIGIGLSFPMLYIVDLFSN